LILTVARAWSIALLGDKKGEFYPLTITLGGKKARWGGGEQEGAINLSLLLQRLPIFDFNRESV
jgi:hypothetical protein